MQMTRCVLGVGALVGVAATILAPPAEASYKFVKTGAVKTSFSYGDLTSTFDGVSAMRMSFWVDMTHGWPNQTVFSLVDGDGKGFLVGFRDAGNELYLQVDNGSQSLEAATNDESAVPGDGWTHFAFDVRFGGSTTTMRSFVNGTLHDTVQSSTVLFPSGLEFDVAEFMLGRGPGSNTWFRGHIHDLFIGTGTFGTSEINAFPNPDPLFGTGWGEPISQWGKSVDQTRLLYAPLRDDASALVGPAPGSIVTPVPVGTDAAGIQSMGPPLDYSAIDPYERVILVGDTQTMAKTAFHGNYHVTAEWIGSVDQLRSLNIVAVFHPGDYMISPNLEEQRDIVRAVVPKMITDDVPFGMTLGDNDGPDGTTNCPAEFPHMYGANPILSMALVDQRPWFRNAMTPVDPQDMTGKAFTYSFEFTLGGSPQLGIVVPLCAAPDQEAWVEAEAAAHPDHRVWIVTHVMSSLGFYRKIPNVGMILAGHDHGFLSTASWAACWGPKEILRCNPPDECEVTGCGTGCDCETHCNDCDGRYGGIAIMTIQDDLIIVKGYNAVVNEFTAHEVVVPLAPHHCYGNLNGDCCVDSEDVAIWLDLFEDPCVDCCIADINRDGVVDGIDLTIILTSIGECP